MIRLTVFIVASAGLAYLSRASLLAPRSHGFYRFFAWEFMLVLVLLNAEPWFRDPLSLHQIIAWLLLIAATALAVHGAYLLHLVGKPDDKRDDDVTLIGIEKTTRLVTVGAFRYIRHPLYSSLLFGTLGVFFKDPSWPGGILTLAAAAFLVMTAKAEEAECIRFFGPAYRDYMKRTKMFVPFLF